MKKSKKKKLFKTGSILVYSLILIFAILTISIGFTKVVVTKQKTASTINQSSQSFQIANSGIEAILYKKENASPSIIQDLGKSVTDCNSGVITYNIGEGQAKIYFYDSSDTQITNCNDPISNIDSVKSVGEVNDTKRAIQIDWN